MFDPPPDQPLSIGDIIGRGFRATRPNLPLVSRTIITPMVVITIVSIILHWAISEACILYTQSKNPVHLLSTWPQWIGASVVLLIASWYLNLRMCALCRVALGFSKKIEDAWTFVWKRKWAAAGTWIIWFVVTCAVSAFWFTLMFLVVFMGGMMRGFLGSSVAVTGVSLTLLGLSLSVMVCWTMSALNMTLLACEPEPLFNATMRTLQLSARDLLRTIGFGILFFVVMVAFAQPLQIPIWIITIMDMIRQGVSGATNPDKMMLPLHLLVIAQVWQSLVNMVLTPIYYFAFAYFYYDLRIRTDALDITRRLARMQALEQR